MLAENIKDIVWILDAETLYFRYVSPSVERLRGYTPEEIIAKPMKESLLPEAAQYVTKQVQLRVADVRAGRQIPEFFTNEIEQPCKNGSTVWTEIITSYYINTENNHVEVLGVTRDISERKRTEENLRRSESKFRNIYENGPFGMVMANHEFRFINANTPFCLMTGYTEKELQQLTFKDITHPDDIGKDVLNINKLQNGEIPVYKTEKRYIKKDGSIIWGALTVTANYTNDGQFLYNLAVIEDITNRKKAETALYENQLLLKAQNEEYLVINEELQEKNLEYAALNEEYYTQNEDLIKAKEHAEQSDRLKTAFLQNMSHEIRTPMNAIMGFSELLTEQFNNKPKLEQYSKIIHQRSSDLLEIINGILDVAKIEAGQVPVNIEECNLPSMFSEIELFFEELQVKQNKQHIDFTIEMDCGPSNLIILTDKIKLKQILINLISNAFKFTEEGQIKVGCKPNDNDQLLFYVLDTGSGIPEDKKDFIFERFTQLEQNRNQVLGGTGLGLSIVKGLVDLLGGNIWLESEVSKGSVFYFTCPYEKAGHLNPANTIDRSGKYNFSDKTILIVEDNEFNAEYLKEALNGTGIRIIHTVYGSEAIHLSKTQSLDIILMDIRLPDIDGYSATKLIRKEKPGLKIIAQTAYAVKEDKEKALKAGCNDYLSKPIRRDELLSMINEYLSKCDR